MRHLILPPSSGGDKTVQNPRDPFRPFVNSPKLLTSRTQNDQVTSSDAGANSMTPRNDGKQEWRLPNARQGFQGVAKKYQESKKPRP